MRASLRWILVVAVVAAGLVARPKGPPAVEPALIILERLGYWCDDGEKELGPPNGLYQWHCSRSGRGPATIVLVEGNDQGIAGFTIGVDDTDPAFARQAFDEIRAAVPPLAWAPWLAGGLAGWSGPEASLVINEIRVTGLCDATQCLVYIVTATSPIEPLPLP
jgi:hypothetical protein